MARMQKKKPGAPKKVKADGDSAPGGVNENHDSVALKSDADAGAQEIKAKKKSPGDQTFLMKLLDRYFGTWIQFLREVRIELGKVVWPGRKDTTGLTAVVLVFVLIVSLFLGIMDFGLSSLVRIIL